ncbi:MAG TPA: hypothetical protein VN282_11600 [Pyrinomonadaceae bacterium]|nr:hypothetical protein [Pyrinomonadaceae bacterium]
MEFFSVGHNTFDTQGFPWADSILSGLEEGPPCGRCGVPLLGLTGDVEVSLRPRKGTAWPDVLGCGDYPLFIVSGRVLKAWREEGIGRPPHHRVFVVGDLPRGLRGTSPPDYYWLDGARVLGARMDFGASGFVGVRFCGACGNRTDNVAATYGRRREGRPYVFVPGSWNGARLFTTDLSPAKFFCTDELIACARKHGLTNFRFVPVAEGDAVENKGLKYLA